MIFLDYTLEEGALAPTRASKGANGLDLYAHHVTEGPKRTYMYNTGVSVAIPDGYVGLLFPRSSISKTDMHMRNCVGVIDSDYRGPISVCFSIEVNGEHLDAYRVGERIAQLVILPAPGVNLCPVSSLPPTSRGSGGWGSTGK